MEIVVMVVVGLLIGYLTMKAMLAIIDRVEKQNKDE